MASSAILAIATAAALGLALVPNAAADSACVGHWEANDCNGLSAGTFTDPTPSSDGICNGVFVSDVCVGTADAETGDWTCFGIYVDFTACVGLQVINDRFCVLLVCISQSL